MWFESAGLMVEVGERDYEVVGRWKIATARGHGGANSLEKVEHVYYVHLDLLC